jgi:hypothetical protein
MFKINTLTISITVAIIIAIIAGFLYEKHGKVNANTWDMIPNDAALIIEIDKPSDVLDGLNNGNMIWQSLLKVHDIVDFNSNIILLDTLLKINRTYSELFHNSNITIAFFSDLDNKIETLILSKLETKLDIPKLKHFLAEKLGRNYAILNIAQLPDGFKIVDANNSITSYFSFIDGVFIYSSTVNLLTKLNETYGGSRIKITADSTFSKLMQTSGRKVHARTYIKYSRLSKQLASLIIPEQINSFQWFGNFAGWTEVDILIKKNELIFSGFSTSSHNKTFLGKLKGQKPVKIKATSIMPYNTNAFVWVGCSDYQQYFNNCNDVSSVKSNYEELKFDINKFVSTIGNEFVFASNAISVSSVNDNSWLLVSIKDKTLAETLLKQYAINTNAKKIQKYNDYKIRQINNMNFVTMVFGSDYGIISNNYFTFIDNYVVFANSESSIINLINYFETGKTLDLNDNFKIFSDNISSQSNLLIYTKPVELLNISKEYLRNSFYKQLIINENVISSFQGVSLQVSMGKKLSFTNFYVKHGATYHEENLALWKVQLDDEIVVGPFIVRDHQTKTENIIVFDKLSNIYLINSDGKELWKRKLDNIPMSNIFEVDYYKNNKIQYLFNTGNYIYLIDKNGKNVTGYPKKLHSKATNGVAVFDYLNNKDYRLLIAQSDKRVHNYSIKGKEIKGWKLPKTQNIIVEPVARLLANKKDYIIITDIEDEIKIVDRKGKKRIKISGNLKKAKHSNYYVNRTNSKGIIITTNDKGKLVYISSSGKLNYTDFGNFSPGHFFLYEDFNGDNSKDFIFIDGKDLKVFDRFKKVLFSYNFDSEITIKPSFFTFGKKQRVLGVVANEERTIYLFDKKGNIIISKGLVGETPFTVGDLERNNKINLISAAGSTLYNYRLK